jgi:hypothetical protein
MHLRCLTKLLGTTPVFPAIFGARMPMDISQLSRLGKVAGVPGIALGGMVLVLGAVLATTNIVPAGWRGPMLIVVAVGVVLLGVLAVYGWARGSRGGAQVATTEGDRSAAGNIDKSGTGGSQRAGTRGPHSPASNVRE